MAAPRAGDTLGRYRIEKLVARSGMASIWRGPDLGNGQPVAIQIPHPEMEADPVFFDRFQREQEVGCKLDHPYVMKVYADDRRSDVYMVMEWVEGRLLREILREQGKLAIDRPVRLTGKIAEALFTSTPTASWIATLSRRTSW
jgi:serine/threonine-protein kinase